MPKKKTAKKLHQQKRLWLLLISALFALILAGLLYVLVLSPKWSTTKVEPQKSEKTFERESHDLQKTFEKESSKLGNPIEGYGVNGDQNYDHCEEVLIGARKNEPNVYGTQCQMRRGGRIYVSSDNDKARVKEAAKKLTDGLRANGWQADGGHADIAYWTNHLIDNSEAMSKLDVPDNYLKQNILKKQINDEINCDITSNGRINEAKQVEIMVLMGCTYREGAS